jgi:hypothetical protein
MISFDFLFLKSRSKTRNSVNKTADDRIGETHAASRPSSDPIPGMSLIAGENMDTQNMIINCRTVI